MVAVLFARADSVYKALEGCDVWDAARDARKWQGGAAVVAHPPCRGWSRMRQFSNASEEERALAPWAVDQVRRWGGVLEHPAESTLWIACSLPLPGRFPDEWGGWSMAVDQFHWGHRAKKPTWLYVMGVEPDELPELPQLDGRPGYCVRPSKKYPMLKSITHEERERTPPDFARWLVEVARLSQAMVRSRHQRKGPAVLVAREACISSHLKGQLPMWDTSYLNAVRP